MGLGFRDKGLGFRDEGLGFRVLPSMRATCCPSQASTMPSSWVDE